MKIIYEESKSGRKGYSLPPVGVPPIDIRKQIPEKFLRKEKPNLPELSEPEVVRHFVNLSAMNHHVDKGFYPLGSCTMKYNPKINEETCREPKFTALHPLQPDSTVQGALRLMAELAEYLLKIVNLDGITLQPSAGAQGEFTGIMMIHAYYRKKGNKRSKVLIPDSAHGTNPASVTFSGYKPVPLPSNDKGLVSLQKLAELMDEDTACLMLTNPNTLGLFEREIAQISQIVHSKGGLLYLDGANLNALVGVVRPGDCGFDVIHFNLHKTFSTPHGGGGPGSGPVAVRKQLLEFLPVPCLLKDARGYRLEYCREDTIGKVHAYLGNFLVLIRAYTYIKMIGEEGLRKISKAAIINANYVIQSLKGHYKLIYDAYCMHEGVLSGINLRGYSVRTLDVAKRLLDFNLHAPTIYFPLIVPEALMIEPTESESKESLDYFIAIMKDIAEEAKTDPELLRNAPYSTPVRRLDEVKAAKEMTIRYSPRR